MNRRGLLGTTLILALLWWKRVLAVPPPSVQAEVDSLLAGVEASGCLFYRNGSWHDSKAAVAHLRGKYDYLSARNLIITTEDFIERAATQSSLSGQSYEVKCGDSVVVTSNRWLRARLARLRAP